MLIQPILRRFSVLRRLKTEGEVRVAIVSTPRSGNTWLRLMLDHAYQFSRFEQGELALYNPLEAPWGELPERSILMTHWHRTEPLPSLLKEHRYQVVTLARHPLDVLISVLQYAPCEGSLRWLEGQAGDERPIFGATPESDEFIQYATGPRAKALLEVSLQWWSTPGCHRIRYEKLVDNPRRELVRLSRSIGVVARVGFDETVAACTIDRLRNPVTARHFWKGKPGLWKTLLTSQVARRIAQAHPSVFSKFGYDCRPDRTLSQLDAARNWCQLSSGRPSIGSGAETQAAVA